MKRNFKNFKEFRKFRKILQFHGILSLSRLLALALKILFSIAVADAVPR